MLTSVVCAGALPQGRFVVLRADLNSAPGGGSRERRDWSGERRKSGDDILSNLPKDIRGASTYKTIHAVQSPRKTPTIFDAFRPRSKSDAAKAKKPTTLIAQMKNAVQVCCCGKSRGCEMNWPLWS